MASISALPNGGYRAQVYVRGVRDTKVFRTKREATAWAAARETELRGNASKPVSERHTLREAAERYAEEVSPAKRGRKYEQARLAAFAREPIAALPLSAVTADVLAAWRDSRLRVVTTGTVLREMTLIRSVLEQCRREWLWLEDNPIQDVRRPAAPDHRQVLIRWRQIRAMLRAMRWTPRARIQSVGQSVACCFLLALRTGMRAGELTGLTWDRVRADYVILPLTKTVPRTVPLSSKAQRVLRQMRGWDDVSVFGLTAATLDALFRKYRARCGLSGFTFHDSRHVAATMLARRLDVLELCRMFGWSSTKHALVYFNASASDIARRLG
jgi:integrase